jgi:hypothetical protein
LLLAARAAAGARRHDQAKNYSLRSHRRLLQLVHGAANDEPRGRNAPLPAQRRLAPARPASAHPTRSPCADDVAPPALPPDARCCGRGRSGSQFTKPVPGQFRSSEHSNSCV